MWLYGFYYGAFHGQSCLALCIMVTSLGEESAGLCASHGLIWSFARVNFCPFSLPLGVSGWLRFVIEALPGVLLLTVCIDASS